MSQMDKKEFYKKLVKKVKEVPTDKLEYLAGYLDGISKSFDDAVIKQTTNKSI